MSICRSNFGVCVLDGKIFAVGGTNGLHSLESVEVFNLGRCRNTILTCYSVF